MKITKQSILSGKVSSMELPIEEHQLARWANGMNVQDAFPNLSAGQREFLMTGITPEEWASQIWVKDE